MLRWFRDEYLVATDGGRALVEHYYKVAPPIAERLSGKPELEGVWGTVRRCVEAIERGQFEEAVRLYRAMVTSLESSPQR